ncbi:toll/interleukin-1 receptor domain-containing protein [Nocardia sp. SYP-A9097]|uniref:toll/interleukin-1 receptor domain-containing protein n=1 Tax=Nocardia sp. SYP-A9097 TaxID=2663237 RepID=UPI00189180AE|nr:toll/interleukin-1 receptor domain-containing protein [Nocardia sp. SYP-A9097]
MRIFMSHSSKDNAVAIALRQWLIERDQALADEVFLDVDSSAGIAAGLQWKDALRVAVSRCEALVCLVSTDWLASRECLVEYRTAEMLGKRIFIARLEPIADGDITKEWQRSDLHGPGPTTAIQVPGHPIPVELPTAGLTRLLTGLKQAGIAATQFTWPPPNDLERAPYRGWQTFDSVDAAVYFGRDTEVVHGLERLRAMRATGVRGLFVVLGPSGTGKSSFLRAGLLPHLAREDHEFVVLDTVRPERNAVTGALGLAASLHATGVRSGPPLPPLGDIKNALMAGDAAALRQWLADIRGAVATQQLSDGRTAPTLLLPIDQAEELFAADAGIEGPRMLDVLSAVLSAPISERVPLIVAATIRTDRYEVMQSAPQLAEVGTELFDELKPMPRHRFRDIVTGPAGRAGAAGHRVEFTHDLIDQLLTDCHDGADALPLLALTLAALYRDYGHTGLITRVHYTALGGVANVVATEIDKILDRDPTAREQQLALLRTAFIPWLATVAHDSDQPLRRIARYNDLPATARPLIDRFVDQRLLVKDHDGHDTTVEVALESLLRQWDDLAGWLRDQAEDLRTADTVERDAVVWAHHGCADAWLLTGARLHSAETLSDRPGYHDRLAGVADYLTASRHRENQRTESELVTTRNHANALRRRARGLLALAAAAVLLAVLAGVGFVMQSHASTRADARARDAISTRLTAEGTQMLVGQRPDGIVRGLYEILAADALAPGTPTTEHAFLSAQYRLRDVTKLRQLPLTPTAIGISRDRSTLVAGDSAGNMMVIRGGAPEQPAQLPDRIYTVGGQRRRVDRHRGQPLREHTDRGSPFPPPCSGCGTNATGPRPGSPRACFLPVASA